MSEYNYCDVTIVDVESAVGRLISQYKDVNGGFNTESSYVVKTPLSVVTWKLSRNQNEHGILSKQTPTDFS